MQTIATTAEAAFRAERNCIAMAAKSKKPSDKVSRKICKYIELTQGCEAVGSLSLSSVLEPITNSILHFCLEPEP